MKIILDKMENIRQNRILINQLESKVKTISILSGLLSLALFAIGFSSALMGATGTAIGYLSASIGATVLYVLTMDKE